MRFNVNANILKDGVLSVVKALPVRSAMPVLEGVQIVADQEGLLLRCSDLTLQKDCRLAASVETKLTVTPRSSPIRLAKHTS